MSRSSRLRGAAALLAGAALGLACNAGDGSRTEAVARAVVAWAASAHAPAAAAPAEDARAAPPQAPGTSRAAGAASGGRAPAPEGGDAYYRYEEPGGSVRFVRSLAEIPPEARAGAERIAIASRPAAAGASRAAARAAPPAHRPGRAVAEPLPVRRSGGEVVVYSASWCGWCRKTLAWLDARGVAYENRDIETDPRWRAELLEKTGRTSVPVVDVRGNLVRGYDPAALARLL